MFLKLDHQKLDIYKISRLFVSECYAICKLLPAEERFAMSAQIRRAALSVHLNIAEGASRKSALERKRFYEVARGSIVEVDAAIDIAVTLHYLNMSNLERLEALTIRIFQLLTGFIKGAA